MEYAIKNGPEFEVVVREREQDNPAYSFLFGGDGHGYYRYKLWMATRPPPPFNPGFPPPSMMHPPNPMMSPSVIPPPPIMMGSSHLQQLPPYHPPFYDQQLPHLMVGQGHGRPDFDHSSRTPSINGKGLSGPLPSDIEMELNGVLNSLTGTKDSIKSAKTWFMQRSAFIPALAEALCDRMFATDDPERQLHIIYLANDILFDSMQRRVNPQELDNVALAFKPVLGSMLARIYHNPQNREDNQSRIQKIVQFWASKEVYGKDTIFNLEQDMINGLSPIALQVQGARINDASPISGDPSSGGTQSSSQWQPADNQEWSISNMPNQMVQNPLPIPQFHQTPIPSSGQFTPIQPSIPPSNLQQAPTPAKIGEKPPPYPLFPPGLIPGMVRKMQIGSGVPYSPLSPLDIPTTIPPSNVSQSEILERVSKFFREIGEVNPSEGPMKISSESCYEYEKEPQVRKGGACIPPPPSLNVDPDAGTFPDGCVERKPGTSSSGRLGLGATADPNEPSQYDDVYSSYRKQRSTNYHSSMSARAGAT